MHMIYGYARVSSKDQNLDRQIEEFMKWEIPKGNIYCDKCSGKDFDRIQYFKLLRKLKPGDLLLIKSIDRLGRNYSSIIEEWSKLTNVKKVDIKVLDMPLLDTRDQDDNLIGKFISDIVLQILSFVAENERTNIKIRQAEGIMLAKAKGVKFGRPRHILDDIFKNVAELYIERKISINSALEALNYNRNKFFYYLRAYKEEKKSLQS